jgi:hypothetical protein
MRVGGRLCVSFDARPLQPRVLLAAHDVALAAQMPRHLPGAIKYCSSISRISVRLSSLSPDG